MPYKSQIPILVNYQATHDSVNDKRFPLGTDYSYNYSNNKSCFLFIADTYSKTAIGLKSFLKSFNFSLKLEHTDLDLIEGKKHSVKSLGFSYSFEVSLPAVSVNDARVNATRLEMLDIMIKTSNNTITTVSIPNNLDDVLNGEAESPSFTPTNIPLEERKLVLLSNLINNGKYTNKKSITTYDNLEKYGLQCYIDKLSYSAEVDMGFFEYRNKLWPKVYSLKIDLVVPTKVNDRSLIKVFTDEGGINPEEINSGGTWPFGVKTL
tara:strand:+ start:294 stop:1085 length:792 start_codon:yes stop_codon:yes gene_type:complete